MKIAAIICACTYAISMITILSHCRPIEKNWQVNPDPGGKCVPQKAHIRGLGWLTAMKCRYMYLGYPKLYCGSYNKLTVGPLKDKDSFRGKRKLNFCC